MKTFHASLRFIVPTLIVLGACFVGSPPGYGADPSDAEDEQGTEVLTRGPVHEAFAGVVAYNPEPGVIIPKAPPVAIEEIPPDQKPEGDNITWIPGYWAWDDERNDFLWISGVWRALPPGRQWIPGYWANAGHGYQWTSGYWADARVKETTYLPPPPPTLERGPNIDAPSPDYYWVPGCWIWYGGRYAWQPGYWVVGQQDWVWSPSYYSWTPRGYVFVDGYWDYSVGYRGCLFAPVYFRSGFYTRRDYYYSPRVVIDLDVFPDHLFFRPSYHHCYFGDYYAINYYRSGFYASFSFQSRRYGCDPIYTHRRWQHRDDRGWEHHEAANYQYRRDHEDARPPRTWVAQKAVTANVTTTDRSLTVATTFDQLVKRKDTPQRFQTVAKEEKQRFHQRDQEVRQSRDERRTLETKPANTPKVYHGATLQPTTGKLPKSSFVAPVTDQPGRDLTPPTPRQAPQPSSNVVPRRDQPTREPKEDRDNRQPEQPRRDNREKTVPVTPQTPPQAESPAPRDSRPHLGPAPRRDTPPEVQPPAQRESPPATQPPVREKVRDADRSEGRGDGRGRDKGEVQLPPPARNEPAPTVQPAPARREPAPTVQPPPARHDRPAETPPPARREPPPEAQQPARREPPPQAQPAPRREAKPEPVALKEKQRDSDKDDDQPVPRKDWSGFRN